ncbi:hypothetical protein [Leisingera sp.]|uniref:hypothetical protein n=1 Tax=Leisingera sp. TaxID=1879318 RepID=UPI003A8D185D
MKHYAGLDVSVKETPFVLSTATAKPAQKMKIASHPEELSLALRDIGVHFKRIGLEAGPLSH